LDKIWQCIGNDRPEIIAKVEKVFWRLLFSFAEGGIGHPVGSDNEVTRLHTFIEWAQGELNGISEQDDKWFQPGSLQLIC